MKRFFRIFLFLLGVMCLTSCSNEESPSVPGSVRVVFRLYVPAASTTAETRADGHEEEQGETWESSINLDQLHIVLYAKDGKSIGGLESVKLVPTSNPNVYDITGSILVNRLNLDNGKFNGKIMVYANIDGVDEAGDFSEANVNKLSFTANTGKHDIPMWGVKQLNVGMKAGYQTSIGNINLMRAEAKVKVFLRKDMEEHYELTKVTLSAANAQGYCLPQYSNVLRINDVQELDHDAYAHFLMNNQKLTDIDMLNKAIYIPEYENKNNSNPTVIHLSLMDKRDGKMRDFTLPFVQYDDQGAPTQEAMDIVRNHYYKFEVYLNQDDMLSVKLVVRKWYVVRHPDIIM